MHKTVLLLFKCRKNIESKNPRVLRTKTERIMFLSKRAVCNSKKSKFLNELEAKGLLNNLTGILNTLF